MIRSTFVLTAFACMIFSPLATADGAFVSYDDGSGDGVCVFADAADAVRSQGEACDASSPFQSKSNSAGMGPGETYGVGFEQGDVSVCVLVGGPMLVEVYLECRMSSTGGQEGVDPLLDFVLA